MEEVFIGGKAFDRLALCPLQRGAVQPDRENRDDGLGDLVLKCENVVEVAVEAFGPDVVASLGLDQLGGNAEAGARLPDAAFDDIADTQLSANVLYLR